jgi:gliding motility-associated protein GldM
MAGYKETPRQKMIGMMYLFYTALLALNVSAEILNAFVIVNDGMERTVRTFGEKNTYLYADFESQYAMNKTKVGPFYNAANEVKTATNDLVEQIKLVKDKVVDYTEYGNLSANGDSYKPQPIEFEAKDDHGDEIVGKADRPGEVPLEWIKKKSNFDAPMVILLGVNSEDGTKGEATKLKNAFKAYKEKVKEILVKTNTDTTGLKLGLETKGGFNQHAGVTFNWEMNTFFHTVLAADLVLLNKYITEVRNIEFEVVKRLYNQIDASDFKFDEISAKVIPKANIVLQGEPYEADIFVAAYSTTDTPSVVLKQGLDSAINVNFNDDPNAVRIDTASQGVIKYRVNTGSVGEFKYAGVIQIKDPVTGGLTKYPFSQSYQVIKPTATVSADKMNVVYRGLENPLTALAPGFTAESVSLSASGGGSIRKTSAGHFIFKPTKGGREKEVTFRVSARNADGNTQSLGSFKYRIKNLPSPAIRVAGTGEGAISKSKLLLSPKLVAQLDDFLFEGVQYRVLSYEIFITHPSRGKLANATVNGSSFPGNVIGAVRRAPVKTLIIIRNVWVDGPDGRKQASGITLELK